MTAISDDDRKVLRDFFGAYFHQDWHCDADTPEEVVAQFVRDEPSDHTDRLRGAILHLMDDHRENAELENSLYDDYGCEFLPSGLGLTVKGWLQSIASMLSPRT